MEGFLTLFRDVKFDLTRRLEDWSVPHLMRGLCGFAFTYTKEFVIYGDIYMSAVC